MHTLQSTYMHVCTSNIYSCNEEGMIKICDNGLRSRAATDVLPSLRSRNRYYSQYESVHVLASTCLCLYLLARPSSRIHNTTLITSSYQSSNMYKINKYTVARCYYYYIYAQYAQIVDLLLERTLKEYFCNNLYNLRVLLLYKSNTQ